METKLVAGEGRIGRGALRMDVADGGVATNVTGDGQQGGHR